MLRGKPGFHLNPFPCLQGYSSALDRCHRGTLREAWFRLWLQEALQPKVEPYTGRTKTRVRSLCCAADGLGRWRAGPGRWHGYGSRNNTLGFVPGPHRCPAEAQSYWVWKTSCLPRVGVSTEEDVLPLQEEMGHLGLLHEGAGSASGQTGPGKGRNKETYGSFPPKPLEPNLRISQGWVQLRGCPCWSFTQHSQRGQPTRHMAQSNPTTSQWDTYCCFSIWDNSPPCWGILPTVQVNKSAPGALLSSWALLTTQTTPFTWKHHIGVWSCSY